MVIEIAIGVLILGGVWGGLYVLLQKRSKSGIKTREKDYADYCPGTETNHEIEAGIARVARDGRARGRGADLGESGWSESGSPTGGGLNGAISTLAARVGALERRIDEFDGELTSRFARINARITKLRSEGGDGGGSPTAAVPRTKAELRARLGLAGHSIDGGIR